MTRILPRYPVYVPSKGRYDTCFTAKFLLADRVPFYLVVEPQEEQHYRDRFPGATILVLPENDQGLIYVRNWIKDHSVANGDERHWQIDDNIRRVLRWFRGKRIPCDSGPAFAAVEDFVDRYENVAIAGLNYAMFAHQNGKQPKDPFWLNVHVYSCTLVLNSIPNRWRSRYNDDTDMCLQVLSQGWCTVSVNAFMVEKLQTMTIKGGNTDDLYHGDGRLKMANALERRWPGVVETKRRFGRPQHVVKNAWKHFDTPLKRKSDSVRDKVSREYGLDLKQVSEIKSDELRSLVRDRVSVQSRVSNTVLDESPDAALSRYLDLIASIGINASEIATIIDQTDTYLRASRDERTALRDRQALEQRWYASIAAGAPDFSVYDDPAYLADLWVCWIEYSRTYLRSLYHSPRVENTSVFNHIGPVSSVVDLGCGFGYTTAALCEMWPDANVTGTNLRDTVQWRLAELVQRTSRFALASDLHAINRPVDLVFASEYFEHFHAPVDHLRDVLDALDPRALLIANTFTSPSIGHFPSYRIDSADLNGKMTSRRFNDELRSRGYVKIDTRIWNDKPAYWRKQGV